jgi:hypothetical protein
MVAWAGIERLRLGALDDPTDMEVRARWPLGVSHVPPGDGKVTSTKHTKLTSTRAVASAGGPSAVSGIEGVLSDSGARTTGFAPTENPRIKNNLATNPTISPDAVLIFGLRSG